MAAIRYQVYFSDSTVTSGDPGKTGLTPAFTLCNQMASPGTAVVSPPAITADGGGFYGWNWDTEANGEFYWKIDGGSGLTVNTDRYLSGQCASAEPMRSADVAKVAAAILATPAHLLATDASGRVTVAGYASGEDPATLVWNAATASFDAAGSFGAFVQAISGGGGGGGPTLTQIVNGVWNEATSAHATAGSFAVLLDAIAAFGAPPPAATIATAVLTTAMAESYSTAGGVKTLAQGVYEIAGILSNMGQSGTTLTAYKLDTVTPAMTFTLNNPNAPTTKSRAS